MKSKNAGAMLDEIAQEPGLFEGVLREKEKYTRDFVNLFLTRPIKRIYFSGCGSPGNVGLALKYAAIKLLKMESTMSYPMLFNNHEGFNVGGNYKPEEMLLICPAESGKTKGPVLAARKARELGMAVVCTTLNPKGVLARECDVVLEKPSGEEIALPSTKGHSVGLFMLLLCLVEAAHAIKSITEEEYQRYMDGFARLPASCADARVKTVQWFEDHQDIVMNASNYKLIGYGANYATMVEGMLKFIETHRRSTSAFELEEFMHGPIRAVFPDDVIFFFCTEDGPEKERMFKLFEVVKQYTKHCILVQSSADSFTDELAIRFDAVNLELLSAVEYLVPLQVLSYEVSDHLGLDMSLRFTLQIKDAMEPSFKED